MGEEGLKLMHEAAREYGLAVVSEVMDQSQMEMMLRYVDIYQVGARNMQNFTLLRALSRTTSRCCSSAAWRLRSRNC